MMPKVFKCMNCSPESPCYLSSTGETPAKCPFDVRQRALWLKAPAFDFTVSPKRKPVIYAIDFDGTIVENRGEFDKLPHPTRTEKVFAKLNSKLSDLSDAELIAETEVHCHLFMMNTPGGQYLAEFVRRTKKNDRN